MEEAPLGVQDASVGQAHAAGSAGQRVIDAAKKTTGEVLPHGGDRKSEAESSGKLHLDSTATRASASGVSVRTQRKLDALARAQAGELSARRAWAEMGKSDRRAAPPR